MQAAVVVCGLVLLNVIAAGLLYALYAFGISIEPTLDQSPTFKLAMGVISVAGTIYIAYIVVKHVNRRR